MDETLNSETPNQTVVQGARYIREERALAHRTSSLQRFQNKFLINGMEVRMKLVLSKDSCCLMETKSVSKIRILQLDRKKSKNKSRHTTRPCADVE